MTQKYKKKKNTGLVYEFAIRHFCEMLIDGNKQKAIDTAEFIQKHFSQESVLYNELEVHNILRSVKGESKQIVENVLNNVKDKIGNDKDIEKAKNIMLRDANKLFGESFFSRHRVSDYRMIGAVQMFVDSVRAKDIITTSKLQEALAVWLSCSTPSQNYQKPDVDSAFSTSAKKAFVHRYGNALSARQVGFLEQLVKSTITGNKKAFIETAKKEKKKIARQLLKSQNDPDVNMTNESKEMFTKAIKKLAELNCESDPNIVTEEILSYHSLCDQLESA